MLCLLYGPVIVSWRHGIVGTTSRLYAHLDITSLYIIKSLSLNCTCIRKPQHKNQCQGGTTYTSVNSIHTAHFQNCHVPRLSSRCRQTLKTMLLPASSGLTATVEPHYSKLLKCRHLILMDALLGYGLTPIHYDPWNADTLLFCKALERIQHHRYALPCLLEIYRKPQLYPVV